MDIIKEARKSVVIILMVVTGAQDNKTIKIDATRSGTSMKDIIIIMIQKIIMLKMIMKKIIIDAEEMTLVTYLQYRQAFDRLLPSI